ncbi:zinc-binding dehydrogenase [Phenylobacterium sp. J367]|uniref:zinc-binding dehydrogenase n=1 Tax=Phenylobacterium sp. J367 TaxID=2898435 RepID=UPI00215090D0|nr:zinc-binding dehydrogenase [Phenylobacterium sp. J367]MCR5879168.1 zinc-binding dehydrogenase [Phenylobacterium sp. J367]
MTICGLIAHYGDTAGDARAAEVARAQGRGVTVHDLFVGDFVETHHDAFLAEMGPWVAAGKVRYREDIREGLDAIPAAFADMLKGGNFGKTLVRIAPDPTLA